MAGETHTGTEAHGAGGKPAFPPFEPQSYPGQLLWFAIAFGLLYYVMSKIALPKVGAIIDDRQQRIGRDLEEAQALRTRSEESEAEYQRSLTEAQDRAKGIAQETRNTLAAETDASRKALEAELAGKLAAAETTIRSRTADAMSSVRGVASETASAIVERLTGRAPDGAALSAALDRSVRS